ncbi:MAG: 3'-5' exonuclease [Sandaracinaceae bacterium]
MSVPNIPDDAPWTALPLAVLDLEGNGYQPPDLVELAVIHVDVGIASAPRTWLVKPDQKISRRVSQIHGIRNADVANAPTFAQVSEDVFAMLDGRYVVAHNATVDWKVLRRKLPQFQPPGVLDTLRLARAVYPGRESYSLSKLLVGLDLQERLKGVDGQLHRATYDAAAALELLLHLVEESPRGKLSARQLVVMSELSGFTESRQGSLF